MTLPEEVAKTLEQFYIKDEILHEISEKMQKEFVRGLEVGSSKSSIAMLPSFVPALPDGTEVGKYVAIDLSGKNLRIMLLTLKGNNEEPEQINHNYVFPASVMKGTGDQLFTFIVNCLMKFLNEVNLLNASLPVGFVFSYPCELLSIRSARLLWWTKGFDIKDCLQKDVVKLLEEALELNMLTNVKIQVIMNDTVGQLAATAYKYGQECKIGVVIGYGCNSSYLENTARIKKFNAAAAGYKFDKMVVVTEWEEFGGKVGELANILTQFDRDIDEVSVHKGKQIIDKLTGALYLGELARRILIQFVLDGVLFSGHNCEKLDEDDSFPTKYISEILRDDEGSFRICRRICDELDVPSHCTADYEIIHEVCHAVSQRSASIVAAAIAALLLHLNESNIKVGVGGALVQFHPTYLSLLEKKLYDLAPMNIKWELVPADEGSAKGAAIVAAVAEKLGL
uniref:Phosphotransferase n=1 Tax=Onchocerca volvulus TaxID=6282 RepID=A0A8R1XXB6_ONCVO